VIYRIFFIAFCSILVLPRFSPTTPLNYIYIGFDSSWQLALQYAFRDNLIFGKDVIFTYGPLFFLHLADGLFIPKIYFILSGSFQLTYLIIGLNLIFEKIKNIKPIAWLPVLFITLFAGATLRQVMVYYVLFSTLFLFHGLQNNNVKYIILSILGALICFYIKIDTGFPLLFAVIAGVIFFCVKSKQKLNSIKLCVFLFALLILSSVLLNVNIFNYLEGGFYIIMGYGEVMNIILPSSNMLLNRLVYSYIVLIISVLITVAYYFYKKKLDGLILFQIFVLCGFTFIFYKKGTTLSVVENVKYAIESLAFVSLWFSITVFQNSKLKYIFIAHFFILNMLSPNLSIAKNCSKIYPVKKTINNFKRNFKCRNLFPRDSILLSFSKLEQEIGIDSLSKINFENDTIDMPEYKYLCKIEENMKGLFALRNDSRSFNKDRYLAQKIYLPYSAREKVKNKTVDIYPRDIHFAYYNKLNYQPRPTLQNYCAYNKYLDFKNSETVNISNNSAVDFIIWDCIFGWIGRYKFWDAPLTMKNILENYEWDETIYQNNVEWKLLLKKRNEIKKIFFDEKFKIDTFKLNQLYKLPIEKNKLLTAKIKVEDKPLHKILKTIYRSNKIRIEINLLENRIMKKHTVYRNILKNGVIINKYIRQHNQYDELQLFKHNFETLKNVESIKIVADPTYFKEDITIEILN